MQVRVFAANKIGKTGVTMNWLPAIVTLVGFIEQVHLEGKFYSESYYKNLMEGMKKCSDEIRRPGSGKKVLMISLILV